MRYLVLSDIHANLEALQEVLAAGDEHDATLFLGDLVGYGPNPNECTELLRSLPSVTSVVGNHDVAALGEIDLESFNPLAKFAAEWTQREMSSDTRMFLESLAQMEELDGLTVVHGSPRDPVWEYLERVDQAPENFARFTTPVCFVGHTHVPRILTQKAETRKTVLAIPDPDEVVSTNDDARRIINPGSIGQPRDNDPRASYGLFDSETGKFEFRRLEYDLKATQKKMEAAGLPKALADRLAFGF